MSKVHEIKHKCILTNNNSHPSDIGHSVNFQVPNCRPSKTKKRHVGVSIKRHIK